MTKLFGFSRASRLRRRREFVGVEKQGRKMSSSHFIVFAMKQENQNSAKLGITVSKRVGNAVTRNHVKRLVREVFRTNQAVLPAFMDTVVIAKARAKDIAFPVVAHELTRAWKALSEQL